MFADLSPGTAVEITLRGHPSQIHGVFDSYDAATGIATLKLRRVATVRVRESEVAVLAVRHEDAGLVV